MLLPQGTRLGPYEIVAPIGAGGMGEVYRARDTRLGRSVAIKILPPNSGAGPEARSRFEREARAISSLNHPNICTLHDIGHDDGIDYLVLEHLEGETLADRLERGSLPIEQVLTYASQIADALDRAHKSGIVHRDLKPGNIMLTASGAKLLDFGLARSALPEVDDDTTAMDPTMRQPLTAEGTILGTFQYMAPEQLEGKATDARTDLWAFGAVVYEMVTGRRAFHGKSQAGLIASIMTTQPAPITDLAPMAPPELERIVLRCMEKDPDQRWQTARDLMSELRWVMNRTSSGESRIVRDVSGIAPATAAEARSPSPAPEASTSGMPTPPPGAPKPRTAHRPLALGGVILAAVVVVVGLFLLLRPKAPGLNPDRTMRTVQVPLAAISYPGLSADGRWIALPAGDENDRWHVYFMNAQGGETRQISADADFNANYADISPDGSQVVYSGSRFLDFSSAIRVVPSLGGESRVLAEGGIGPHWAPDGQRIGFVVSPTSAESDHLEFWTIRPDGSDRRRAFIDTEGRSGGRLGFAWSPDGREIAWIRTLPGTTQQELFARDLATGKERQLTRDGSNIDEVIWSAQDRIIFSSNRRGNTNLWMIPASGGDPEQITSGVGPDIGIRISADGRSLLYLQQQPVGRIWLGDLDAGTARQITHDDIIVGAVALSPDRTTIAAIIRDPDPIRPHSHLWLMNRDGGDRRQITRGEEWINGVSWSSGTNQLCFASRTGPAPSAPATVFVMNPLVPDSRRSIYTAPGVIFTMWVNEGTILVGDRSRGRLIPASGGDPIFVSPESTYAFSTGSPWQIRFDLRRAYGGFWMTTPDGKDRRILDRDAQILGMSPENDYLVVWKETGRPMKLMLPEGNLVPIPGVFPGMTPSSGATASSDLKEFVYRQPTTSSKLVMIENLLED